MLESTWDEIFHMLHACTKRFAPLLHQTMYEACDMRNKASLGRTMMAQGHGAFPLSESTPTSGPRPMNSTTTDASPPKRLIDYPTAATPTLTPSAPLHSC